MRKADCRRGRVIAISCSRFVASRGGAAASELALVLPIFLLCLFGITSFASTLFMENNMVNAAREGARFGSLQGVFADDVTARVQQYLAPMGLNDDVTIAVVEATEADPVVTVSVTAPREDLSLIGNFFGWTGGTVEGTASMRKEGM